MSWTYSQSSGEVRLNGSLIGVGYSGFGAGVNNPDMERVRNVGPIPTGIWDIGIPYNSKSKGVLSMRLTPKGHTAHGRTAFMIHGDSKAMNRTASRGCIIASLPVRAAIGKSGYSEIEVIT